MNLQLQENHSKIVLLIILLLLTLVVSVMTSIILNYNQVAKTSSVEPIVDPMLELAEQEILEIMIEDHNYLVYGDREPLTDRSRHLVVVPVLPEADFLELITIIETELWRYGGFQFQTELNQNQAIINLSLLEFDYKVIIEELTPNSQTLVPDNFKAKLGLVIDDWGYSSQATDLLLNYPFKLTHAILPYLNQSVHFAEAAMNHGHEVILHQPMEPLNSYLDIGKGGITGSMNFAEIESRLEKNLEHLPMVKGVNNHMGSRTTADYQAMEAVLTVVNNKGLYFLDSLTTSMSVTGSLAPDIGIPYAINNHFIDNVNEVERVKAEIRVAINQAHLKGTAIAIGHVRPATAIALWEMIPEFVDQGIQLVPVSELLLGTN